MMKVRTDDEPDFELTTCIKYLVLTDNPYSKVHEANMGPTWVLSAPDGPHVGPMNLTRGEAISFLLSVYLEEFTMTQ